MPTPAEQCVLVQQPSTHGWHPQTLLEAHEAEHSLAMQTLFALRLLIWVQVMQEDRILTPSSSNIVFLFVSLLKLPKILTENDFPA